MRTVPVVGTLVTASPAKRLWVGGLALATFLLALMVGNAMLDPRRGLRAADLGHDFLAFHTAAVFVRDGRSRQLYDLPAVAAAERATAAANGIDLGDDFGPWWNPPAYALALSPLARLPYRTGLAVWWAVNVACAVTAAGVLAGWVRENNVTTWGRPRNGAESTSRFRKGRSKPVSEGTPEDPGLRAYPQTPAWRHRWPNRGLVSAPFLNGSPWLVPLLLFTSMPFVQAASHGQNTCTSLLILAVAVACWRAGRAFAAGLVGGLLFYKPQLATVLATVMAVDLGWAAVGGLAVTGIAILLVTVAVLPGTLGDWVHRLPANVRTMQVGRPYLWDRHVTLKAFWRLLIQGKAAGEPRPVTSALTAVSVAAVAVGLGWATLRARRDPARRDRLIAAAVTATPLLMPFYFDYDLLLLAVPVTLYAVDRQRDRRLTAAWAALYVWLFANAPAAAAWHVNVAVVLLSAVAGGSILRAGIYHEDTKTRRAEKIARSGVALD